MTGRYAFAVRMIYVILVSEMYSGKAYGNFGGPPNI
jgi:hypothetical protein